MHRDLSPWIAVRRRCLTILACSLFGLSTLHTSPGTSARAAGEGADGPDLSRIDLSCPTCNFILLNIELLRADHVGLLDPSRLSNTPAIDRFFADSALIFEDASAPAGESYRGNLAVQTAMSAFHFPASEKEIHRFIADGAKASNGNAWGGIAAMLTRFPTMAQYFQSKGFHTVSMNQGVRAGRNLMLDRGFDEVTEWSRQRVSYVETIDELVSRLESGIDRPFLLHYRPEVLHPFPYYYPDSRPRITLPGEIFNHHRPQFHRFNIRFGPALPEERKRVVHRLIYDQQVRYVDDELSRVLAVIRERNLHESSVVILYANHGTGLGDNGVHKLAVSYQSCIHVPLMIRHPKLRGTVRITAPVPLIDLAPTLMDMASLEVPGHFEGMSLLRDFTGNGGSERYIAGRNDYDEYIRRNDLKLLVKNAELLELYDLATDPGESLNLAERFPRELRTLKSALEAMKLRARRLETSAATSPD